MATLDGRAVLFLAVINRLVLLGEGRPSSVQGVPITYSLLPAGGVHKTYGADGSYAFNYDTPTSSRSEDGDAGLNVKGSYSFRTGDGRTRTVNYRAGAETGYVAEGDDLPVAPAGSLVPSVDAVDYSASGSPEAAQVRGSTSPDGGYSFEYETPTSSRSEGADANLNVRGQYSFRAGDGRTRTVNYRAGAETGYVAQGDDLPVAPAGSPSPATGAMVYSFSEPQQGAAVRSSLSPDGGYSFSYETPTSSRSEDADPRLNVRGQYSFRAGDGRRRTISYRAGAATGFIADGDDLPVAPAGSPVPLVPDVAIPAIPQTRAAASPASGSPEEAHLRSFASPDGDARDRAVNYKPEENTGYVVEGEDLPVAPTGSAVPLELDAAPSPVPQTKAAASPASGSPEEAQLKSSVSPNGDARDRAVNYKPGENIGFVAEEDDLPVAPEAPAESPAPSPAVPSAREDDLPVAPEAPAESPAPSPSVPSVREDDLPVAPEAPAESPAPSPSVPSARAVASLTSGSPEAAQVRSSTSPDGSYSFEYETPTSSRSEGADANLNVRGQYSFRAGDGRTRTVNYRAGAETGYVAEGDDLPVAPAGSPSPATRAMVYSFSEPQQGAAVRSSLSPDGGYSFSYETPTSSRSEDADPRLNVRGQYSFRAGDGRRRTISYRAGAATGFIADGDDLPVAPEDPAQSLLPSTEALVYSVSGSPEGAQMRSSLSPDGGYSFSYETPTSSRSEDADPRLNVRGQYSFRAGDGRTRTINYRAGAETGYVAEGDDLPVTPGGSPVPSVVDVAIPPVPQSKAAASPPSESPEEARLKSSVSPDGDARDRAVNYKPGENTGFAAEGDDLPVALETPAGSPTPLVKGAESPLVSSTRSFASSTSGSPEEAQLRSSVSPDGGYSFSYETKTSSRSEDADPRLNVRGQYSFRAGDGRRRTISYRAGAATGFIADGDDLPVAPEDPAQSLLPSTEALVYSVSGSPEGAQMRSSLSPDGGYSFSYETPTSSRSEDADPRLNVRGQYSFRAGDGRTRTVNYRAGAETGYVAEGYDLPVAPAGSPSPATGAMVYLFSEPQQGAAVRSSLSPDGGYSFSYETPTSSRSEDADASLNVRGQYTFRAGDGGTRSVTYRAGAGTGFVAQGQHLPRTAL
ncbi:uncharacterized protein [Panulirus ornatus]|uniref:uncharacterized protein n=1 Tax=Panulirus ornatus TaxID=150431 RepID=UPI003A8A9E8E